MFGRPSASEGGSSAIPLWERLSRLHNYQHLKYDFRPKPRLGVDLVGTWIDQDESGNYDPHPKRLPFLPPRLRVESAAEDVDLIEVETKRPKISNWLHGRQTGSSLVVILKISSDAGKAQLAAYAAKSKMHDNLPDDIEDSRGDIHAPLFIPLEEGRPRLSKLPHRAGRGQLPVRGQTSSALSTLTRCHPRVGDRTLALPEVRGCKACLELGLPCPLLEPDSTYPCDNCVEDEYDCELVLPPERKRACEACRKVRVRCSYRDGGDHSLPCERCRSKGGICCAGPETRFGTNFFLPTPARPFLTCTPCRIAKRWCSLSDKSKEPPCNACFHKDLACTFESIKRRGGVDRVVEKLDPTSSPDTPSSAMLIDTPEPIHPRPSSPTPSIISISSTASAPRPLAVQEQVKLTVGVTKTITTRYAHPLHFSFECLAASESCAWCTTSAHGLFGHGDVKVEVIDWGDGQGYTEISGGHTGQGVAPDRMCGSCTSVRLCIATCEGHTLRRIPGLDAATFDFDAAFGEWISPPLLSSSSFSSFSSSSYSSSSSSSPFPSTIKENKRLGTRWCGVCPSPAFYACTTHQATAPLSQAASPHCGCGLMLCEACTVLLARTYHGDLGRMIVEVLEEVEGEGGESKLGDFPVGVRADAAFLANRGPLLRRALATLRDE